MKIYRIILLITLTLSAALTSFMYAEAADRYTYSPENDTIYKTENDIKTVVKQADRIFVDSTVGSDKNDGSYAMPVNSIAYAVNKAKTYGNDTFIILKPGKYVLDKSVNIYPEDSYGKKLVIMSYGNGATISGEKILTGEWDIYDADNNIYVTNVEKGLSFRQLYVNGVRAKRASTTDFVADLVLNSTGYETTNSFFGSLSNPPDIEFVYKIWWMNPRCNVESITNDGSNYVIKMNESMWEKGNSYMRGKYPLNCVQTPDLMENAYEFIDEVGEWYYNTDTGKLFYKADINEDLNTQTFTISKVETIINIKGSANMPCTNVEIHNISFENTAWEYVSKSGGFLDTQASCIYMNGSWYKYLPAAINIESADSVIINGCELSKLGANAINVIGASKNITISGNTIYDVSGSGIVSGNIRAYQNYFILPWQEKYSTKNITISNNLIHNIGVEYGGSVAVQAGYIDTLYILNNEVYEVPYSAIHVGWGWQSNEISAIKDNLISRNYIHDFMLNYNDGAAIYTLGSTGASNSDMNIIAENYIKAAADNQENYKCGIYLDQGSNFWEVHNNVVEAGKIYDSYNWLQVNTWKYNYIHDNYTNFDKYNLPYKNYPDFAVDFTQASVLDSWDGDAQKIIDNAGIIE